MRDQGGGRVRKADFVGKQSLFVTFASVILEDQQLARVLMLVGGGLVYSLGAGLLFVSWLA